MTKSNSRSGQMLLVVVLTMIVALTVGLSVVSRTITNLRISRQNEESQRAFKAAEAGIEQALQSDTGPLSRAFSNNAEYSITRMNPEGTSFLLNGGELVDQGTGADLWLSKYPDFTDQVLSADVTIYWSTVDQNSCVSTSGESVNSALEVAILSGNVASPLLNKYVFDSCGRINGATPALNGGPVEGVFFNYAATIPVSNGLIMRLIPIYNSTKVGITSVHPVSGLPVALPPQGTIIESVGESGETVRKVQYFSSHPLIPFEIFPYSLISQ